MRISRVSLILVLICCFQVSAAASDNKNAKTNDKITEAAKQATPLKTDLSVKNNVTAQSVLLPYAVATRVFGKEVAKKYAVIELNINNKSSDAALIVQGVYIDYRNWALSGGNFTDGSCDQPAVATSNSSKDQEQPASDQNLSASATSTPSAVDMSQFTHCTDSSQVASEEYRVVRGQALNAQTWTRRNTIVRGMILAGVVLTGFTYTAGAASNYPKAVAAVTGQVIPGFQAFWPDQTIDQINRISDWGYQTNKVIAKQGSDIMVCFFPIDRFLTPGFKDIFLKYPALFFAPYEMLVDKKIQKEVFKVLPAGIFTQGAITEETVLSRMQAELPCHLATKTSHPCEKLDLDAERALNALDGVSLNRVSVVIDGIMTVETGAIPAKIESIVFDNEKTDAKLWVVGNGSESSESGSAKPSASESTDKGSADEKAADKRPADADSAGKDSKGKGQDKGAAAAQPSSSGSTKTLTGTITGVYLTGGTPMIQNKDLGISDVSVVTDGSNDQTLKFSLKLSKTIPDQTELTFVVEKKTDGKSAPVDSTPFVYRVNYAAGSDPTIGNIKFDESADWSSTTEPLAGTIYGSNLSGGTPELDSTQQKELQIKSVAGVAAGSSDSELRISVELNKAVDPGTVLKFTVKAKPKGGKELTSNEGTFTVPKSFQPKSAPAATKPAKKTQAKGNGTKTRSKAPAAPCKPCQTQTPAGAYSPAK